MLLVDDSRFVRRAFGRVLREAEDVEIVGEAANGAEALELVASTQPDVALLDVSMPVMDGLEVLERLRATAPKLAVVVVSSAAQRGAEVTLRALELGAFDFVDKSAVGAMQLHDLKGELLDRLRAAAFQAPTPVRAPSTMERYLAPRPSLIAIGASTGGPQALAFIARQLPTDLPCPIVVVQHIAPAFAPALAGRLRDVGRLPAELATLNSPLRAGTLYVAPAGIEVEVARVSGALVLRALPSPATALHAPQIDTVFTSGAAVCGSRTVGVLLTGMGRDGARGLLAIRRAGGFTVAEHASTCAVYGMPRAAVELGAAAAVLPLQAIPEAIAQIAAGPSPHVSSPQPQS